MTIIDYQDLWKVDSFIDHSKIDDECLKISVLHSKYLNFLSTERLRYKRAIEKRKKVELKLTQYFEGSVDGRDIGREPFQLKLGTNAITKRVETDSEFITANLEIALIEESVLFLKEALASINQRSFNLRNFIEWAKFTGGQL